MCPGSDRVPFNDELNSTRPPRPAATARRTTACVTATADQTFRVKTKSKSLFDSSNSGGSRNVPTLFTSTSTPPRAFQARRTISSAAPSRVRSAST